MTNHLYNRVRYGRSRSFKVVDSGVKIIFTIFHFLTNVCLVYFSFLVCVCISVLLWCFILISNQCGCTFVASE